MRDILDDNEFEPEDKVLTLPLLLAIAGIFVGALFMLMHWPYGRAIVIASCLAIVLMYPIRFARKRAKAPVDYLKLIFVLSGSIRGVFIMLHWPYKWVWTSLSALSFLGLAYLMGPAFFGIRETSSSGHKSNRLAYTVFVLSLILIMSGLLFRIMHWPMATEQLFAGLAMGGLWYILSSFGNGEDTEDPDI